MTFPFTSIDIFVDIFTKTKKIPQVLFFLFFDAFLTLDTKETWVSRWSFRKCSRRTEAP